VAAPARARAEAVLSDLLRPVGATTLRVPMPRDPRAARVARELGAHPSDPRDLAEWGQAVGASGRTLARLFRAETGLAFGAWRTRLRLQATLPMLAAGSTVAAAARHAGYATPSAFVSAFRRTTGVSPGAYFTSAVLASPPGSPGAGEDPGGGRMAKRADDRVESHSGGRTI